MPCPALPFSSPVLVVGFFLTRCSPALSLPAGWLGSLFLSIRDCLTSLTLGGFAFVFRRHPVPCADLWNLGSCLLRLQRLRYQWLFKTLDWVGAALDFASSGRPCILCIDFLFFTWMGRSVEVSPAPALLPSPFLRCHCLSACFRSTTPSHDAFACFSQAGGSQTLAPKLQTVTFEPMPQKFAAGMGSESYPKLRDVQPGRAMFKMGIGRVSGFPRWFAG